MKRIFKDKKITIMGLGLHGGGVGVAKFFCRQGARVLITDLKTKRELKESLEKLKRFNIEYVLGCHRKKDFINTDLVIRNPGVPKDSYFLKLARANNIPVETDITIFFRLCSGKIIGITGTKGKSTVATLVYQILKTKYKNTILAGNIGISPLEFLSRVNKKTKVVLELSSFELEDLKKSPDIAVITCILPDHLDRYKNMKEYVETKKIIFKYQKEDDFLVLNYDDPLIRRFSLSAPSKVCFYSVKVLPKKKKNLIYFLKNTNIFFAGEKKPIFNTEKLKIYGKHNVSNVLAAISVGKILKIPSKNIKKVLSNFKGVSGRQEFIREVKGVKYFNDTTATMPEATITALKTFSQRFPGSKIILIAGGVNKKLDYKELAQEIQKRVTHLILLPGSASEKIKEKLKNKVKISLVDSMKKAVKKASKIAKRGDVVLLSPASASFNLFKNEFDRGNQFVNFVKHL